MGPTELTVLLLREVISEFRWKCRQLLDYAKNSVFGSESRNY